MAADDNANMRDYIVQAALARGINPKRALAVAGTEGGTGAFQIGDQGTSGGPFQLHVKTPGGVAGMGDDFRRETGLNPLDPANQKATVDYALDYVARHGGVFDPNIWHGARSLPRDDGYTATADPNFKSGLQPPTVPDTGGTAGFGVASANLPSVDVPAPALPSAPAQTPAATLSPELLTQLAGGGFNPPGLNSLAGTMAGAAQAQLPFQSPQPILQNPGAPLPTSQRLL